MSTALPLVDHFDYADNAAMVAGPWDVAKDTNNKGADPVLSLTHAYPSGATDGLKKSVKCVVAAGASNAAFSRLERITDISTTAANIWASFRIYIPKAANAASNQPMYIFGLYSNSPYEAVVIQRADTASPFYIGMYGTHGTTMTSTAIPFDQWVTVTVKIAGQNTNAASFNLWVNSMPCWFSSNSYTTATVDWSARYLVTVRMGIITVSDVGGYEMYFDSLRIAEDASGFAAHCEAVQAVRQGASAVTIGAAANRDVSMTLRYGTESDLSDGVTVTGAVVSGNGATDAPRQYWEFPITGLAEDTTYYYEATLTNDDASTDIARSGICQFELVGEDTDTDVVVVSDTPATDSPAYVAGQFVSARTSDLALHCGDLSYVDFNNAADATQPFQAKPASITDALYHPRLFSPMWGIAPALKQSIWGFGLGNHDQPYTSAQTAQDSVYALSRMPVPKNHFDGRCYSFDQGRAHYSFIYGGIYYGNLGGTWAGFTQEYLDWLEADLAASDRPWKIVITHFPGFFDVVPNPIPQASRNAFLDVLIAGGANLILSGHRHSYSRFSSNGILGLVVPALTVAINYAADGSGSSASNGTTHAPGWLNSGEAAVTGPPAYIAHLPKYGSLPKSIDIAGYVTLGVKENRIEIRAYRGSDNTIFDSYNLRRRAGGRASARTARA